MTDPIESHVHPHILELIDELGANIGLDRSPGQSPHAYLAQLLWFQKREQGLMVGNLRTATDVIRRSTALLNETLRNNWWYLIIGALLQTFWAVVPLVPLIQLLGGPVTVYAAWVALICLAPVIAKAVFELYWRIRGNSSELEGGKSA